MKSILAGLMIGIGGLLYLTIGGIVGSIYFSIGLLTILLFKLELFTGKAGLVSQGQMTIKDLFIIWLGNLAGTWIAAESFILMGYNFPALEFQNTNNYLGIFFKAIFCGLIMFIAVSVNQMTNSFNTLIITLCVSSFILCGFRHCVADMFYLWMCADNWNSIILLLITTLGNFIGCNILPFSKKNSLI